MLEEENKVFVLVSRVRWSVVAVEKEKKKSNGGQKIVTVNWVMAGNGGQRRARKKKKLLIQVGLGLYVSSLLGCLLAWLLDCLHLRGVRGGILSTVGPLL